MNSKPQMLSQQKSWHAFSNPSCQHQQRFGKGTWSLPSTLHLLLPKEDGAQDTPPKLPQDSISVPSVSCIYPVTLRLDLHPNCWQNPTTITSYGHVSPAFTHIAAHISSSAHLPIFLKSPLTLPITATTLLHCTDGLQAYILISKWEVQGSFWIFKTSSTGFWDGLQRLSHIQPSHVSVCALWVLDQSPGLCHISSLLTVPKRGTVVSHILDLTLWYL